MTVRICRIALLAMALCIAPLSVWAIEVKHVYHEPPIFDPRHGESVRVHFQLLEPARMELLLYDGRDLQVASVKSALLPAGGHELAWEGRDAAGRVVPPEAYAYTLRATDAEGRSATWDLTDATGGDLQTLTEAEWDDATGRLRYRVPVASRVRIRIGLANNGPLLRTLLDWVPRAKGEHEAAWDGLDASGVVELGQHPNLSIQAMAFTLPRNTILVGPPEDAVRLLPDLDPGLRRERSGEPPRRMLDFAQQSIESRRDFAVQLNVPGSLSRDTGGLPIVTDSIPVQLGLSESQAAALQDERFEAVFYVDGHYAFETEAGFFPLTWTWNPRGVNEGKHYITVNLRGYQGHFGISTILVRVERPRAEGEPGG